MSDPQILAATAKLDAAHSRLSAAQRQRIPTDDPVLAETIDAVELLVNEARRELRAPIEGR